MASGSTDQVVLAAGALVWRPAQEGTGVELLVVHRPRYDDWSFPKGKLDRGETLPVTAVREVAEETGVHIRLGVPLKTVTYRVSRGPKEVYYWVGRVTKTRPFKPDHEVDEIRWADVDEVSELLTYDFDLDVLDSFRELYALKAHRTRSLVVLRHATARPRKDWKGDDKSRPLTQDGRRRAAAIVDLLKAYGVTTVVSSTAVRCLQTVEPFAKATKAKVRSDPRLTEAAKKADVSGSVTDLLDVKGATVACSHRPTLPAVFGAIGLTDPALRPGEAVVVHHRRGKIFGTEHLTL